MDRNGWPICLGIRIYEELGKVEDAYKSTRLALDMLSDDAHNLFNYAAYAAMTRHTDESIDYLRRATLIDPICLVLADNDERFSNVEQEKKKLDIGLRDEQRMVVDAWRQNIALAKKEAEACGIHDLSLLIRKSAEIEELYDRNSYLDLLKAKSIAEKVYEENIREWIKVKKGSIGELKEEGNRILSKSYVGVGILAFMLINFIDVILFNLGLVKGSLVEFIGIISIIIAILTPSYYKNRKIAPITDMIEREKNAIAKLSNLGK